MSGAPYQPPFSLTGELVTTVANIAEQVGRLSATPGFARDLRLRRINRIRSITGSLAIEGNTLTEEQITDLLDGKLVMAPPRELQEARNALVAYDELPKWDGLNEEHLLTAHRVLMRGLLDHPGVYRTVGVGVFAGSQAIHMAPPAEQVQRLMGDLFAWLRATDTHALVASSVFHYEFEFIHPFRDGNGRMGRLWQTLLLSRWNPAFAWLPVESLVHQQQDAYYGAIRASTKATDCAPFIRFMLGCIESAVAKALAVSEKTSERTPQKTLRKTPQKMPDMILALLRARPEMSFAELAAELSKSESAIKRAVRKLREQGRLKRVGPDKGGHWKVIT